MKKIKINVKILAGLVAVFFVAIAVCGFLLYAIYDTSLKPAEFENLKAPASGIDSGYYRHCYYELSAEEQTVFCSAGWLLSAECTQGRSTHFEP